MTWSDEVDATLDDVIERLCLVRKIELGIAHADVGDVIFLGWVTVC